MAAQSNVPIAPTSNCDAEKQSLQSTCPELDERCLTSKTKVGESLGGATYDVVIGETHYILKELPYSAQADAEAQRLVDAGYNPNVSCYFARFKLDGKLGILSERVEGKTLDKVVQELAQRGTTEPLPVVEALLRSGLEALQWLHGKGIAHRDVKPSNIFPFQSQLKLVDVGLQAYDCSAAWPISTTRYMAPEQLEACTNGTAVADHKPGDIWSLAIALMELLTLDPVRLLPGPSRAEFLVQAKALPARIDGSTKLLGVLREMLTVDPAQRSSATQLLGKL